MFISSKYFTVLHQHIYPNWFVYMSQIPDLDLHLKILCLRDNMAESVLVFVILLSLDHLLGMSYIYTSELPVA